MRLRRRGVEEVVETVPWSQHLGSGLQHQRAVRRLQRQRSPVVDGPEVEVQSIPACTEIRYDPVDSVYALQVLVVLLEELLYLGVLLVERAMVQGLRRDHVLHNVSEAPVESRGIPSAGVGVDLALVLLELAVRGIEVPITDYKP